MADPTVGGGQGQGKLATFFNTRVKFNGEKNVSKLAQGLNAIGNAFLAPTRYLMEGRTITCATMGDKTSQVGQSVIFGNVRGGPSTEERGWGKTALTAIAKVGAGLVSIVGVPLGGLIKGMAMLSPELRKRYSQAATDILVKDKIAKDTANIAICIAKGDRKELTEILKNDNKEHLRQVLANLNKQPWFKENQKLFVAECLPEETRTGLGFEIFEDTYRASKTTEQITRWTDRILEDIKNWTKQGREFPIVKYLISISKDPTKVDKLSDRLLREKWPTDSQKTLIRECAENAKDLIRMRNFITKKDSEGLKQFLEKKDQASVIKLFDLAEDVDFTKEEMDFLEALLKEDVFWSEPPLGEQSAEAIPGGRLGSREVSSEQEEVRWHERKSPSEASVSIERARSLESEEEVEMVVYEQATPDELMIGRLHLAEDQKNEREIGWLLSGIEAEPLRRILDKYEEQYGTETLVSSIGRRIDKSRDIAY